MKVMLATLAAFIGACLVAANPIENANTRVFGGRDVALGEYKFFVSLRYNREHFCGGAILNTRYVLTAAHCVYGLLPTQIKVHAATVSLLTYGDAYSVSRLIPHPRFSLNGLGYDVGIVKVSRNFDFSNVNIGQVVLNMDFVGGDVSLTAMGLGMSEEPQKTTMQQLDMKSLTHTKCRAIQYVLPEEFCVFAAKGKGVCFGDSGGPIVLKGTDHQVGVSSRGQQQVCAQGYPDMYSRVDAHEDWILANSIV